MKYKKEMTWGDFKMFCKSWTGDKINGNELCTAEILLDKYKIILTDHKTKYKSRKAGHFVTLINGTDYSLPDQSKKVLLKYFMKNLPSKITQENFDKGMKTFDKGMKEFDKLLSAFGSGIGDGTKERSRKQDQSNIKRLTGRGGNQTNIWSTKKSSKPKRKKGRRKSNNNSNQVSIWGSSKKSSSNNVPIWGKRK